MRIRVTPLVLATMLVGCAGAAPKEQDGTPDNGQAAGGGAPPELRVFFAPRCPVSNTSSESVLGAIGLSIASNLAGKLAGGAVDKLGAYLSQDKAVALVDSGRMEGFAVVKDGTLGYNPDESCMIVMAGRDFGRQMTTDEIKAMRPFGDARKVDPATNLQLNKLTGLSGPLAFYMELTFHFNRIEDLSAFTLTPRSWYYPAFFTPPGWHYGPRRDLLLRMEFSSPGSSGSFGAFELKWQGIGAGEIQERSVIGKKLPWSPLPSELDNVAKRIKGTDPVPVSPTNVKVLLTETAKPHTILKYLGEALQANKDTITTAAQDSVNQAFSQEARAAARSAAAGRVEERYTAYVKAYDEADAAQQKYADASGAAAKQKALTAARLSYAKLSAVQASLAAIYGSADLGAFTPLPALPALP